MEKSISFGFSVVTSNLYISLIIAAIAFLMMRVLYVVYRSSKPLRTKSTQPLSTLIVMGSGGHTAEMLNLLSVLRKDRFTPRFYIAAATDNMSFQKAQLFENTLIEKVLGIRWSSTFYVESIARVRRLSLSGLLLYKLRMADQFLCNGRNYIGNILELTMWVASCSWFCTTML